VIGTRAAFTNSRQTAAVPSGLPSFTNTISCPPSIVSSSIARTTAPIVSALR
jgi:hypothetical protein